MGPGSVVSNKYRLLRSLGEGGMGAVWEALNLRTQRRFALKLVRGDASTAPELRERMLREASHAPARPAIERAWPGSGSAR